MALLAAGKPAPWIPRGLLVPGTIGELANLLPPANNSTT